MHTESIDKKTKLLLEQIKPLVTKRFYLGGGTALAIQLGHRKSIDLDFFSQDSFDLKKLERELSKRGKLEITGKEEDTLHGIMEGVKVSFIRYSYPLLFPLIEFEGIELANKRDISAMKIDAIAGRGSKKDFIDLYFLLKEYDIDELMQLYRKKYSNVDYNETHILKSLVYFEDAEKEPSPKMIKSFDWGKAKAKIIREAKRIV